MGKRVEGKRKRKSIKAKLTSRSGADRVLSRFGKKIRKGQVGPANDFLPRAKVLKKLKINLRDFRRLSIIKGIYPRVPSKYAYGADKTYYHIKDISHMAHDPLLSEMKDYKIVMDKICKASERTDVVDARRRDFTKPTYTLDRIVKERYPRFIDALHDLDDALNLVHLYASIGCVDGVEGELVNSCQKLVRDWTFWVASHHALRKVFVSVKGIYYSVDVPVAVSNDDDANEFAPENVVTVIYLVPHYFTPHIPQEIDFRIMNTFCELHISLLSSVLAHVSSVATSPSKTSMHPMCISHLPFPRQTKGLVLSGLSFLVSTEQAKHQMEVVIYSAGGKIVGSKQEATHIITDLVSITADADKELVQPQWVFDAVNAGKRISCEGYRPGCDLPVHYSPFEVIVDVEEEEEEEVAVGRKRKAKNDDDDADDDQESKMVADDEEDDERNAPVSILHPPTSQFEDGDVSSIMTHKNKKLYKAMQLGLERKREKKSRLTQARKKIRQANNE